MTFERLRLRMIARSSLSCTSTLMVLRFSRSLGPARLSRQVGPLSSFNVDPGVSAAERHDIRVLNSLVKRLKRQKPLLPSNVRL